MSARAPAASSSSARRFSCSARPWGVSTQPDTSTPCLRVTRPSAAKASRARTTVTSSRPGALGQHVGLGEALQPQPVQHEGAGVGRVGHGARSYRGRRPGPGERSSSADDDKGLGAAPVGPGAEGCRSAVPTTVTRIVPPDWLRTMRPTVWPAVVKLWPRRTGEVNRTVPLFRREPHGEAVVPVRAAVAPDPAQAGRSAVARMFTVDGPSIRGLTFIRVKMQLTPSLRAVRAEHPVRGRQRRGVVGVEPVPRPPARPSARVVPAVVHVVVEVPEGVRDGALVVLAEAELGSRGSP